MTAEAGSPGPSSEFSEGFVPVEFDHRIGRSPVNLPPVGGAGREDGMGDEPYAISHAVRTASRTVTVMHPDRMHADLYDFAQSLFRAVRDPRLKLGRQARDLLADWRPWLAEADLPGREAIIGLALDYEAAVRADVGAAVRQGAGRVLAEAFVEPDLLAEYWRQKAIQGLLQGPDGLAGRGRLWQAGARGNGFP